jgi:hypothetical protein
MSVDEIIMRYRGQLRGKILMIADQQIPVVPPTAVAFRRWTDAELQALREAPKPAPAPPPSPASARAARTVEDQAPDYQKLFAFLEAEGALAFLSPTRGEAGTALAVGPLGPVGIQPPPPPGFNLPAESYNRILRLMQRGVPVRIEVELASRFHDDEGQFNVLAEITGSDMANETVIDEAITTERFVARLAGSFSAFALLLAAVGLYGVMAYIVARRTSEIAIRVALGARRDQVVAMVLRDTMTLTAIGLAIGLPAAFAATLLVRTLLFGVGTVDLPTAAAAAIVMVVAAGLAAFVPARRAAAIQPTIALWSA